MVRRPHHQNPIVRAQAVDFVEEVGSHVRGDDGVEVFEDEQAGGLLPRSGEDLRDGVFGPAEADEAADVEGWDRGGPRIEGVHDGFNGDGFAIAWGAVEEHTSLGAVGVISFVFDFWRCWSRECRGVAASM